ncbi:MAG: zinc ribbon domain-containing protein [Ruminococcus sp.]|nr:zinc ribbon domain-containing protein [Ruminococcus sp.]
MSSFLDKFNDAVKKGSKSVKTAYNSAKDGTKKMVDKEKIKKEIKQAESEINSIYAEIGKKYFEANSDNDKAEYASDISGIKEKLAKIDSLKNEMAAMDERCVCPKCGADIEKDSKFCAKCGAVINNAAQPVVQAVPNASEAPASAAEAEPVVEVEPVVEAEPVAEKVCPNCGAFLESNSKFCEKCGKKLD